MKAITIGDDSFPLKYNAMVKWVEPWPGLDKNGNEIVANIELQANVQDTINMARRVAYKMRNKERSDRELLQEFMVIHHAWIERCV